MGPPRYPDISTAIREEVAGMSTFQMYDKRVMEAVRQLTLEEMLCALCDVAELLRQDRMRDMGPSRESHKDDSMPIRPMSVGLEPLNHAMLSAGFDMPGFGTPEQVQEALGDDQVLQNYDEMKERINDIGEAMEVYGLGIEEAKAYLDDDDIEIEETDWVAGKFRPPSKGPWGWS